MNAIVAEVLPLLNGQTTLNSTNLSAVVATLAKNFTAQQKGLALDALQATVKAWRQSTVGAQVPYEVEASFELAVAAALSGNLADAKKDVKVAVTNWWDDFVSCGCAKVAADVEVVEKKVEGAVAASSLSESVKKAIDDVVEAYAVKVEAAAKAAVAKAEADKAAAPAIDIPDIPVPAAPAAPSV